ncbi:MAG: hypothetical protein UV67_C0001G0011 [Parcubacteria group bacterium GW2011_GWC1_43_12]|nr:MAG: hypothetical protein UV34_C0012G0012 [Parcubacteria group bacterium GW2011_GWB1_42_6]KKS92571.1 MAG: hypothetical protein UV67_C0001G0011 [Parcubacteria group bacterium GW2011_GWC1_43_12]
MVGEDNYKNNLAYIIGVSIGDGNLSNPNNRAVRLRITCDLKYKSVISEISNSLKQIFPNNKVSLVKRKDNCVDISCYSNKLEEILNWKAKEGSKFKQKVRVPNWVKENRSFTIKCLKGLFETDGSIYFDRKYKMANFVTTIPDLSQDIQEMIQSIGFKHSLQLYKSDNKKTKYTIRITKDIDNFIKTININKR